MRKVIYGAACSLDGYIARSDGAVDWLMWSEEAMATMGEFWSRIDAVLLGRKTYEVALKSNAGADNPYPEMKSYVFSRTLPKLPDANATLVSDNAGEFVRQLKQQPGRDICCMGGGELAKSLFEADVIDEVGLNIHPILLGAGIPMFPPMNRPVKLELTEHKPYKNGCIEVRYRVQR